MGDMGFGLLYGTLQSFIVSLMGFSYFNFLFRSKWGTCLGMIFFMPAIILFIYSSAFLTNEFFQLFPDQGYRLREITTSVSVGTGRSNSNSAPVVRESLEYQVNTGVMLGIVPGIFVAWLGVIHPFVTVPFRRKLRSQSSQ